MRLNPVMHLAKMQDFQGEGSDPLDAFFDHVEELVDFYCWDKRETYHQAYLELTYVVLHSLMSSKHLSTHIAGWK